MTKLKWVLLFVVMFLSICLLAFSIIFKKHCASAHSSLTYHINLPYDQVKKLFIKADILKEILALEQGKVVSQRWDQFSISSKKILEGFDVDAKGVFVVEKSDPDLGKVILPFSQTIHFGKTDIDIRTQLLQHVGHIKNIETHTSIAPDGERTVVTTSGMLTYERRLPESYFSHVDSIVAQNVSRMITNNKQAMLETAKKYGDKKFVIPLHLVK